MGLYRPPLARNYASPVVAQPTKWWNALPTEGPKVIPIAIDWGAGMGGASNCVEVDCQIAQYETISQIVALNIDNTRCGSDIIFWFADTQSTITIPAYEFALVPVFTNLIRFTVNAVDTIGANDATAFEVLNTMPPPVSLPASQLQTLAGGTAFNLPANVAGATILAPTVSGTLIALTVALDGKSGLAAPFDLVLQLKDGTGQVLWAAQPTFQTVSVETHANLVQLSGLNLRFKGGLTMAATMDAGFAPLLFVTPLVYYRTP